MRTCGRMDTPGRLPREETVTLARRVCRGYQRLRSFAPGVPPRSIPGNANEDGGPVSTSPVGPGGAWARERKHGQLRVPAAPAMDN